MNKIKKATVKVFKEKVNYVYVFFSISAWGFIIAFLQNVSAIKSTFFFDITLYKKVNISLDIINNFYFKNLNMSDLFLHMIVILLLSLQTIFIIFYIKKSSHARGLKGISLSTIFTLLGTGCATCSTALITFFLGSTLSASLLSILPYAGKEFIYIAIFISVISLYVLSKKIDDPFVCV